MTWPCASPASGRAARAAARRTATRRGAAWLGLPQPWLCLALEDASLDLLGRAPEEEQLGGLVAGSRAGTVAPGAGRTAPGAAASAREAVGTLPEGWGGARLEWRGEALHHPAALTLRQAAQLAYSFAQVSFGGCGRVGRVQRDAGRVNGGGSFVSPALCALLTC